ATDTSKIGPAVRSQPLRAYFVQRTALCDSDASFRATANARSCNSSSGTHNDTRPIRSASSPLTGSQVIRWYLALAIPHSIGQMRTPWSPAATPRRVCPSTILVAGVAIDTSASSPTARPAPTAGPVMADTIGLEQLTTP